METIRGRALRVAARLITSVLAAALGLALAFVGSGHAANPTLVGTVGPDFTISLTEGGSPVTQLDPGTYTILVHDNSTMHDFHLFGPGVDQTTTVDFTGDVTWTVTLVAGASYEFLCDPHGDVMSGTIAVRSAPSTTTTPPPPPPPPPPPSAANADVRVSITDAPASARVGDRVSYSVLVTNLGPDEATGVTLSDELPQKATFVEATAAASCVAGATVRCAIGAIESGSSVALRIVLATQAAGSFVNTISVAANEGDPQAANNRAAQTTVVTGSSGGAPDPDASRQGVTEFTVHATLRHGRPILLVQIRADSPVAAVLGVGYRHEHLQDRYLALTPGRRDVRIAVGRDERHALCHAILRFTDEQGQTRSLNRTLRLP